MEVRLSSLLGNYDGQISQQTDQLTNRRTDGQAHKEVSLPIIMHKIFMYKYVFNEIANIQKKSYQQRKLPYNRLYLWHSISV